MKKGLNVGERLIAMSILPKEGDIVILRAVRELVSKVGLSSEEIDKYKVVQSNGLTNWNEEGMKPKEIIFEVFEEEIIKNQLKKLNDDKKLTSQHLSLYEKFIDDKTEEE